MHFVIWGQRPHCRPECGVAHGVYGHEQMRHRFWYGITAFEIDPGRERAQLLRQLAYLGAVECCREHECLQALGAFATTRKQAMQLEREKIWANANKMEFFLVEKMRLVHSDLGDGG